MRFKIQHIILFFFLLGSSMAWAQAEEEPVDTPLVHILPYIEPLHSDRPGNTFDPLPVRSGVILQGGYGYQNRVLGYAHYTSTQVRIPTCIGEFDIELLGAYTRSEATFDTDSFYSEYTFDTPEAYTSVWYRNGIQVGDNWQLGFIIGANYGRKGYESTSTYRTITQPDTLENTRNHQARYRNAFGGRINLNAGFQINNHWSLGSSIGVVSYDLDSRDPRVTATLSAAFSDQWLSLFAELFTTDITVNYVRYNLGGSFQLTQDLNLDIYYSTRESQFDINNGISNIGFTYFIR